MRVLRRLCTSGALVLALAACSAATDATGGATADTGPTVGMTSTASGSPSTPADATSTPATTPTPTTTTSTTTASTTTASTTTVSPTAGTSMGAPSTDDGGTTSSRPVLADVGLAGVNDPGCRSEHPPVVLLHGTFATPAGDFGRLAPALQASGRCVYAVLYGAAFGYGGIGSITTSARTVGAFLAQVRSITGADSIDVVAFSQGALVLRAALQDDVPAGSVRLAILLAPDYHGTSVPIVTKVPAVLCPSCAEQVQGSALLRALDAGGELAPGVRYASLLLDDDAWVQPLADQSPRGPADRVRVQVLQDACPAVTVPHSVLPSDPAAVAWTLAALESDGRPADTHPCR